MQFDKETNKPQARMFAGNKICSLCGAEFKAGEETVLELGEYPVHGRCSRLVGDSVISISAKN